MIRCELPDEESHGTRCGSGRQQGHLMRHDHHLLARHYDQRTPPNVLYGRYKCVSQNSRSCVPPQFEMSSLTRHVLPEYLVGGSTNPCNEPPLACTGGVLGTRIKLYKNVSRPTAPAVRCARRGRTRSPASIQISTSDRSPASG